MKSIYVLGVLLVLISCKNVVDKDRERIEAEKAKQESEAIETKGRTLEKVGQIYYQDNCRMCHAPKHAKDNFLVSSIQGGNHDLQFFSAFVTKQDSLLKAGNTKALELKDMFNNQPYMHRFKLTEKELKALFYYLKK